MKGQEVKLWTNRSLANVLSPPRYDIQFKSTFIFMTEVGKKNKEMEENYKKVQENTRENQRNDEEKPSRKLKTKLSEEGKIKKK